MAVKSDLTHAAADRRPATRVGLSTLEHVLLDGVRHGAPLDLLIRDCAAHATALAGEDGEGCRRRTASRLLAIEKLRLQLLQARQGAALEAGQVHAAERYDRLITSSTKRITMLMRTHREETRGVDPATMVMVAHAEHVEVGEVG